MPVLLFYLKKVLMISNLIKIEREKKRITKGFKEKRKTGVGRIKRFCGKWRNFDRHTCKGTKYNALLHPLLSSLFPLFFDPINYNSNYNVITRAYTIYFIYFQVSGLALLLVILKVIDWLRTTRLSNLQINNMLCSGNIYIYYLYCNCKYRK